MRVSLLKLESKVSSFPVLEANVASSTNATTKSPFILACVYESTMDKIGLCLAEARDGSSPAVSCLKLEPKVSSFPVLEANVASSTNATAKSPFLWTCVYESVVFVCSSKGC